MDGKLGPRLRAHREERGWSLRSLASDAGISPSMLSQLENGRTQPSVSTLYRLVSLLDVSVDELLGRGPTGPPQEQGAGPVVQRRGDAPRLEMTDGVVWERLAADGTGVDPLLTTYAPGGSSSGDGRAMRHPGTEYGYLIRGELTLELDGEVTVLHEGDSVCFASSRPHRYLNHTDRACSGLWFVVDADRPARDD